MQFVYILGYGSQHHRDGVGRGPPRAQPPGGKDVLSDRVNRYPEGKDRQVIDSGR